MKLSPSDRETRLLQCQAAAALHQGACLSVVYKDGKTKLKWQCVKGHRWDAIAFNILKGHWCSICGNERQGRSKAYSIEVAQNAAIKKGGICLSKEYKNNCTNLHWRCAKGHEWQAVLGSVMPSMRRPGSWCPICAGKLPKDQALQAYADLALKKGGLLVSSQYNGARKKMLWRCGLGHEWQATPDSIKQGSWCPICGGSYPLTLADMRKTAKGLGGECLSTKYINANAPLLWRCVEGHEWKARPTHVRDNHWCPTCSTGISERICRALLEYITEVPFPKRRPSWLRNEAGNWMELDGYAESLGLAFEYHGPQHFQQTAFFHRKESALVQRMRDDAIKRRLCQKHEVTLIEIPHTVKHGDLQGFLIAALKAAFPGKKVIRNEKIIELQDLKVRNVNRLNEMRSIAASRGGSCLSKFYINNSTKLDWRCAEGHEWMAVPSGIKSGSWCPVCGDIRAAIKRAHTIQEMQILALAKGGVCLSQQYQSSRSRLRWRCAKGHEWETQASVIISGHWCPKCEKERLGRKYALTIQDMQRAAAKRGGECLSSDYRNNRSRLRWRCAKGHEWGAIANSVRRGSWCPVCVGKRSLA